MIFGMLKVKVKIWRAESKSEKQHKKNCRGKRVGALSAVKKITVNNFSGRAGESGPSLVLRKENDKTTLLFGAEKKMTKRHWKGNDAGKKTYLK